MDLIYKIRNRIYEYIYNYIDKTHKTCFRCGIFIYIDNIKQNNFYVMNGFYFCNFCVEQYTVYNDTVIL